MNKTQLIESLVSDKDSGIDSKAAATRAVASVFAAIAVGLKRDKNVSLVGFGTLNVTKTKARKGRNPRTGEVIKIKAGKRIAFRAGKNLKDAVAGGR